MDTHNDNDYPRVESSTAVDQPGHTDARDVGASTVEVIGWAAMSTIAIIAIGAALQTLGLDLIDHVRGQLGL